MVGLNHQPGHYDAILMDIRMPEMDGLGAPQVIRAMDRPDTKSIPIKALPANAFDEDVQRSMQAGLNAHLSKPVQPDTLFETFESLIRSKKLSSNAGRRGPVSRKRASGIWENTQSASLFIRRSIWAGESLN